MLYYSQNSRIAHFEGCHHLKMIQDDNINCFDTYAEARENGFRICKCCDPVMKAYKNETEELTTFCAENGLICFAKDSVVYLQTVHSKWKVMPSDEGGLIVYHKNTRFKKKDIQSPVSGYHLQNFNCKDILGVCKYVLDHDCYRYHNPLKKDKKAGAKTGSPKGSRKWRAQQERIKKQNRRNAIKNVYFIFDQLVAARAYG